MGHRDRSYYEDALWCYTDKLSFQAGETIDFRVSSPDPRFTLKLTRIGATDECVHEQSDCVSARQTIPDDAYRTGCNWPIAVSLEIPADWTSGYYRVQLFSANSTCEHFFVLKSSSPVKKIALVLATNTYHAYNSWGGMNLYGSDETLINALGVDVNAPCSPVLSLNRPFSQFGIAFPSAMRLPAMARRKAGEGILYPEWLLEAIEGLEFSTWDTAAGFLNKWEHAFVVWAENNGYEMDYFCQFDLDENPDCLLSYQCYLSVGHDEYWSAKERDAVEAYVEQGGNAVFLSGNTCYWQVRFSDDGREMTGYKYVAHEQDPVVGTAQESTMTGCWSDPLINRPENHLTGLSFTRAGYAGIGLLASAAAGGFSVCRPEHWALAGTELFYGDMFGSEYKLAAYEMDGCAYTIVDGLPVPTGEDGTPTNFEIIATAPATLGETEDSELEKSLGHRDATLFAQRILGEDNKANRDRARRGMATMGSFKKGKGEVFSSGTTEWAYGLQAKDPNLEIMTHNILRRFTGK